MHTNLVEIVRKSRKMDMAAILLVSLSVATSVYILATDDHIYEHALSHAYWLIALAGIYSVLLALMKSHRSAAMKGILIVAIVQFAAMNLDILTTANIPVFHVEGLEFNELFQHLYGSWYFDMLMLAQATLIAIGIVFHRRSTMHAKEW